MAAEMESPWSDPGHSVMDDLRAARERARESHHEVVASAEADNRRILREHGIPSNGDPCPRCESTDTWVYRSDECADLVCRACRLGT